MTGTSQFKAIMSLLLTLLSSFYLVLDKVSCSLTVVEFDALQAYKNINNAVPLNTYKAVSLIHCASFCLPSNGCQSFAIDLDSLNIAAEVECSTMGSKVTSVTDLVTSHLHYAQVKQATPLVTISNLFATAQTPLVTTTTPLVTTTSPLVTATTPLATTNTLVTPTPSSTQVIDIMYGVMNTCSVSSQKDFLVIANDGVYFYDDFAALRYGPCKTQTLQEVFPDYSDLPSITDIRGILLHQSTVELYTSSNVFRWQTQSDGVLVKAMFTTQTLASHLSADASTSISSVGAPIVWVARRARSSVERHFYFGNDQFVLYSEQWGDYEYKKSGPVHDQNGFDMNPWSDIPTSAIAVTGYTDTADINFAIIDDTGSVYSYYINHGTDNNNPSKVLTPQGQIVF